MRYSVRDLLGHFVKPLKREGQRCPHACCRNRRVHPDNFPLILSREQLRRASDEQLIRHATRYQHHDRAVDQVYGELTRREARTARTRAAAANRAARGERAKERRRARESDFQSYVESEFLHAEHQTRGNMLNRAGEHAGVDPRSLFYGDERRARKYASEELRRYWEDHPRVTRAEFMGGEAAQLAGARARRESRLYGVY